MKVTCSDSEVQDYTCVKINSYKYNKMECHWLRTYFIILSNKVYYHISKCTFYNCIALKLRIIESVLECRYIYAIFRGHIFNKYCECLNRHLH